MTTHDVDVIVTLAWPDEQNDNGPKLGSLPGEIRFVGDIAEGFANILSNLHGADVIVPDPDEQYAAQLLALYRALPEERRCVALQGLQLLAGEPVR